MKKVLSPRYILPIVFLMSFSSLRAQQSSAIPSLSIQQLTDSISAAKGVTIFNFWSTWCKPCIDEIPDFIAISKKFETQQVTLRLVSLDTKKLYQSGDLDKWLGKKGWTADFWWLNETNADVYCPKVDESWSGVIPVTLVVRHETGFRKFIEESMTAEDLQAVIVEALTSVKQ